MKASHFLILFSAVSVILIASAMFQYSLAPQTPIHITRMDIRFSEANATADIEYSTAFLTHLYVIFFGSRNLDPYFDSFLLDFEEYRILSVHGTTATIELINSSRQEGLYYLHDTHHLGYEVERLTLYFPDGKTMTFNNAVDTPNVFY
ncbi:MAG: hypothetical protein LBU81_02435 [Methanosarcinales archaeon]|jgi:hypothetical protein|nr:hypothetical protein [Methanosarcinales archaeon]